MRKLLVLAVAIAMVMVLCVPSFAGIGKGKAELTVFGDFERNSSDDSDTDLAMIMAGLSIFTTDVLQFGGMVAIAGSETDGVGSTVTMIDGVAKYHFPQEGKPAIPYVGAQVGILNLATDEESASGLNYGVLGGVKYFVNEDTSFNAELSITRYSIDIGGVTYDTTRTALMFGASLYFTP